MSFKFNDCTFNTIFPFTLGSTQFQVINKLNQLGGFEKNNNYGDIIYNMKPTDCYDGINGTVTFKYSDDKLYGYFIKIYYPMNEYNRMMDNYNAILGKMKHHPIYKYARKDKWVDSKTSEQLGEGYTFTRKLNYGNKPDEIAIEYSIIEGNNGESDLYQIKVGITNLNGTKLTSEKGY